MRLKSIKLAGFKSFVDPTTVTFSSNMSAVVGPNGCGKSNIIDAVKWVMGESSAKNLRGESMTDVIFNGSSARKPVGQASIELIFDNSARTLKGEFAGYNEISVRRKVTREGDSSYFMNGAKCRRKDITDLFLGTGLGPRSYAIIEQGMISKLIEAKPQDLRVFIEEAAGISRYKERRRDTENRIRRSRENMERLTDIRDELERQLAHLDRQAKTAMRYKALKQEERELTLLLWSIQWQDLMTRKQQSDLGVGELQVQLESVLTEKNKIVLAMETLRTQQGEVSEHVSEAQSTFYQLGTRIASLEQQLRHAGERTQQLQADIQRNQQALDELSLHNDSDASEELELQEELEMLSPELLEYEAQVEELVASGESQQQLLMEAESGWEQANQQALQAKSDAEVEQNRCQFVESSIEKLADQLRGINDDLLSSEEPEGDELLVLAEQIEVCELELESLHADEYVLLDDLKQLKAQAKVLSLSREQLVGERQKAEGERAGLDALISASQSSGGDVSRWLAEHELSETTRWFDQISVDSHWQRAFEVVMARWLSSVVVETGELHRLSDSIPPGVNLIDSGYPLGSTSQSTLANKVSGLVPNELGLIRCADSLEEAFRIKHALSPGESVITPDGIWMSAQWLRTPELGAEDSLLATVERRDALIADIDLMLESIATAEDNIADIDQSLESKEQTIQDIRLQIGERSSQKSQYLAEKNRQQLQLEHQQTVRSQQLSQKDAIEVQLQEERDLLSESRIQLEILLETATEALESKEVLSEQRDLLREKSAHFNQELSFARDKHNQLVMREQLLRSKLESAYTAKQRVQEQIQALESQLRHLHEQLGSQTDDSPELQMQLEEALEQKLEAEQMLAELSDQLAVIDRQIKDSEQARTQLDAKESELRGVVENQKLAAQTVTVELGHVSQKLMQAEQDPQVILENTEEILPEPELEAKLQKTANIISRLGAINLAAIEEYEQQSERKRYLDEQNADLEAALETLENAIRRIDKETRSRFKQTFDEVNSGLGELFPQVFGGGQAYLELTDDDLLETGIAIMARPPGKRNSTIHLLSGGEKALTAIALVFAIFRLNPAPFCMLDEVDAPLDDANVGRYARIVKTMSENVQFIYITHNKIPMEYADQLMGVTMQEAGVSRLVSVDINKAAELASM